jgi:hypothetical protein
LKYSILINSTDSFEDCWFPFFTLFKKYWPNYAGKIYLNTETKNYTHSGLNIICTQTNLLNQSKKISWSECLIRALNSIDTEIVLYLQEDYFFKDFVKNNLVEMYVQMMSNKKEIDCIHLTDQGLINDKKSEIYEGLYSVLNKQRYLVNCQAALWKKSTMLNILRTYENAWQFEEFGSQRAAILKPQIFCVDNSWIKLNEFEIIPYIFTGIIQGRWYEPVVDLFYINDIKIDYSLRGFVKDTPKRTFMKKLKFNYNRFPVLMHHYFNLITLRINSFK